jgi:uncharacterized protein (DUF433 family)
MFARQMDCASVERMFSSVALCDNAPRRHQTMTEPSRYKHRIIVDPNILAGKPVVKGTRIPVELVLKRLAQDLDMQTLFEAYPRLTKEDVQACLAYAQALVERRSIQSLGSEEEAREIHASLQSFEEDWNAPGMDAYDEL